MAATVYQIIRRPIITEKGLGVKETQHTAVFEVAVAATKTQIKEAVQKIFKVKVAGVRTANFHGKFRRRGRAEGYRRDWKKAYVKLAAGEKMIEYAENLSPAIFPAPARARRPRGSTRWWHEGKRERWD